MVRCGARKQLQTVHQSRDAVREREVMRDEEASVEVRGVVRDVAQSVGDNIPGCAGDVTADWQP